MTTFDTTGMAPHAPGRQDDGVRQSRFAEAP